MIILFLYAFISICLFIILQNEYENYVCQPVYAGYNQPCDLIGCKSICEPNKYECNISTNRCEYKYPQDKGQSCKFHADCKSMYCFFDASGKNTGIGECK